MLNYPVLLWTIVLLSPPKKVVFPSLFACLSVCLLATLRKNFSMDLHEIFREGLQWADDQTIKFLWRSGSPSGYRVVSGFVTIGRYGNWYQPTARRDAAGVAIATMTSLRYRPTTDSNDRRALAEVCTVPVLLVCNELFAPIFMHCTIIACFNPLFSEHEREFTFAIC